MVPASRVRLLTEKVWRTTTRVIPTPTIQVGSITTTPSAQHHKRQASGISLRETTRTRRRSATSLCASTALARHPYMTEILGPLQTILIRNRPLRMNDDLAKTFPLPHAPSVFRLL